MPPQHPSMRLSRGPRGPWMGLGTSPAGHFTVALQQHIGHTLLPARRDTERDVGPLVFGVRAPLGEAEPFLCPPGAWPCAPSPQPHLRSRGAHPQHGAGDTGTPRAWLLQPRQCPNGPALTAATGASSPHRSPSPRNAFLSSRAAENSWILPQDAPSECENSSSARSHGNCSLATRPHLLFSSLCSCARPPRAAHQAADGPATGTGLPAHPARPRPSPRPGCRHRCPHSRWLCRPQAPCQALGVPFHTWSRGDATRGDGGRGTARPLRTPGVVPRAGGGFCPKGDHSSPVGHPIA